MDLENSENPVSHLQDETNPEGSNNIEVQESGYPIDSQQQGSEYVVDSSGLEEGSYANNQDYVSGEEHNNDQYNEEGSGYVSGEQPNEVIEERGEDGEEEYIGESYDPSQQHETNQYQESYPGQDSHFEDNTHNMESERVSTYKTMENKQKDDSDQMEKKFIYDDDADVEAIFEQDFDLIKKVRKMLLDDINKERIEKGCPYLSIDIITNQVATEYCMYLKNNESSVDFFQLLCDQYKQATRDKEQINLIYIKSKFEEDTPISEELILETFQEIGLILLESQNERQVLFDINVNHIGLGVAATNEGIIVVQIISQKMITIRSIQEAEDGSVEIRGRMLEDKYGLYAAKVINLDTNKDIMSCGPEKIDFDRKTKDFILNLAIENPFKGPRKLIEYFVRVNPDSIPYKKPSREKLKLKDWEPSLKTPCIIFPDLRIMDKEDMERPFQISPEKSQKIETVKKNEISTDNLKFPETSEVKVNQSEDFVKEKAMESIDLPGKSQISASVENEEKIKKIAFEQAKEQAISNKEIKEELEISLAEAQKQYDELLQQNLFLQEKIKMLKNKNEVFADKQGDVAMNEHKYLNTLAHVHQIRLDLKQTQDKYNKMASELQKKLEEKQKKCNEIKMTFMELKREVARKAAFSRTDKPIPEKMIDEWEERETEKNKILQELRLDILRLRNNLAKNKKILKKKEELAEGLHLIDFEQLKIENQTLNEKIEERNEDLHKLKKKNTTTVQILTHTREKLGYVQKKNDDLEKVGKDKENDLSKKRKDLSKLKKEKDMCRNDNVKLKQQSGIVNSDSLRKDFQFRKNNIEKLKTKRDSLKEKLENMEKTIKKFEKDRGIDNKSITKPGHVKFHDDKNTYTGVYAKGGPVVVDLGKNGKINDLSQLADRSKADVRGVKKNI